MKIEYNSAVELSSALMVVYQAGSFSNHNETVSSFINMATGLSSGCSCTRKKRMNQVNRLYLTMGSILTDTDKEELKSFYGAKEVILKFDNETFLIV